MARALSDILTELNSTYNPQRQAQTDVYNQNLAAVDPQQQADLSGLEAAKKDSFSQIETGANRRGMFFSGIPLQEQAKYVGQNYLPAVANLQNRYAQIRCNLRQSLADTLANLDTKQREFGQGIYQNEVNQDIQRESIAAQERAAAASRASSAAGGGFSPTFSGNQAASSPQVLGQNATLRDTWQAEAKKGDWNAQVALNYAGNDGRYDGIVNSKAEYDILKSMGIQGNYTYPNSALTLSPTTNLKSGAVTYGLPGLAPSLKSSSGAGGGGGGGF